MPYLLLTTGGTVQCGAGDARTPSVPLPFTPPAGQIWQTQALCSEDSAYFSPARWGEMIAAIDAFCGDGALVSHGTDTMAYSAAALAYAGAGHRFPVVFTGAQLPPDAEGSDARRNLTDAARVLSALAQEGRTGVYVVFAGKIWDGGSVGKINASDLCAFSNRTARPFGTVDGNTVTFYRNSATQTRKNVKFGESLVELTAQPAADFSAFSRAARGKQGVLLLGYGAGNFPRGTTAWVRRQTAAGKTVFLSSRCPAGESDPTLYLAGDEVVKAGGIPLPNLSVESAYVLLSALVGAPRTERERLLADLLPPPEAR